MMINIIFKILIIVIIYTAITTITNIFKIKNSTLVITSQKLKTISIYKKLQFYIYEINNSRNKEFVFSKPIILFLISIIFSAVIFIISNNFIQIFSTSILLSIISFFIPYFVIKYIVLRIKTKIKNIFPTYALTLKNFTKVTNDIVIAFRKSTVQSPLDIYIKRFNVTIQNGISVYDAFERLKSDINIKKINEFLAAAQTCYINGGDFSNLLDRYSKIIAKSNLQKEKARQENFSAYVVLVILVIINIYMIVSFVFSNPEYKNIIQNTFIGNMILNINILSYVVIFLLANKLNKMEE